jgi:acetyl esterase/lipase
MVWMLLAISAGQATAEKLEYEVLRGEVYASQDGEDLEADVYLPEAAGPLPGVLVVHGGAWMSGNRGQLAGVAKKLAEHGFTAVAISYRLAPKAQFPAQLEDCQAAVRWMRGSADKLKLDPDRIAGYGYSAGGHLVSLLGAIDDEQAKEGAAESVSARLQAVVAGGAPCDFRLMPLENRRLAYFLGGTRKEKPETYKLASPAAFISRDDPPMYFFHGEKDRLVPLLSPQAMVGLLRLSGVPATLQVLNGKGHIGAAISGEAHDEAIAFLEKQLKKESGEQKE